MNRERLPQDRSGLTHRFVLCTTDGEVTGFITANTYPDGRLAEVFFRTDKKGSTVGGLIDVVATMISVALQYGVPLERICDKLEYQRFEPCGQVVAGDLELHQASSFVDYFARWLAKNFTPAAEPANDT